MTESSFILLKTLEAYLGKKCKVVYRDGGASFRAQAFYGTLVEFDQKFQIWEGDVENPPRKKFRMALNHDDINRIILELV